ncbi:hypothetical protein [Sphingosinicella sp. YJ22]|uniref:hypothetical protein n=1 Tax=Sphingosinicella sp. YJ22 TaxID=1104780 RepID=UPI001408C38E|nr:hypothetical protein [Sphingosinicella sp. YJ22]
MASLLTSLAALLSVAQAEAPPSAELVDRFIAALPERDSQPGDIDFAELERLVQLNPGREGDIRPILRAHSLCVDPAKRASTDRLLRQLAATLGTTKVEAMIRFYQGPDLARFEFLARKTDKTPEESAEFEALQRTYPLDAFMEAMMAVGARVLDDGELVSAVEACGRPRDEALRRASLRAED